MFSTPFHTIDNDVLILAISSMCLAFMAQPYQGASHTGLMEKKNIGKWKELQLTPQILFFSWASSCLLYKQPL